MKRATIGDIGIFIVNGISIHALMKRATLHFLSSFGSVSNFNPRPYEEGDQISTVGYRFGNISIHALMKRATVQQQTVLTLPVYFNPRPHEEGDKRYSVSITVVQNFNPRPHEEGDS